LLSLPALACGDDSAGTGEDAGISTGLTTSSSGTGSSAGTSSGESADSTDDSASGDTAADSDTASTSTDSGPLLDVSFGDMMGNSESGGDGSIDETTCEGAAMALTSAGCLFAPIVGNTSSTLPWAVIAANTNDNPANVSLYAPDGTLVESVSVAGQDLHVFEFSGTESVMYQHANGSGIQQLAFRLEADAPVVAYEYQPYSSSQVATSDGSLLLPEHAWGDNYLAAAIATGSGGDNWVNVVSLQDGVTVTVRRPVGAPGTTSAGGGVPALSAGQECTATLNSQQTLKVYGGSSADLTGTQVFSDNGRFAVFSGSSGVNIPTGVVWQDLLEEQVPPRSAWGTDYAVVKFQPRSNEPDMYRIIADKDGTTVNLSGEYTNSFNLNEGEWVEFETAGAFEATANEAFLIAHFLESANSNSGSYDQSVFPGGYQASNNCGTSTSATDLGDPLLSYIAPVDQYRSRYTFLTPFTYSWDMLTVIGPTSGWNTIMLDGQPIPAGTPLSGELSYARFLIDDGAHYIASDSVQFGIEVYGYDCRISYGHAGGLSLGVINTPPPPAD
jgi:hypothetical protein